MQIEKPYLMFIGDVADQLAAKTAAGIVDWRRDWCVGQLRMPGCKADLGLEDIDIAEGKGRGARTMVVGVVNAGGVLPEHWIRSIVEALNREVTVALQQPDIQVRMQQDGIDLRRMSPEEVTKYFEDETARWAPLARTFRKDE